MKNILVVGAGFAGATVARELAEAGHNVHVIDQRDHIAGNAHESLYKIDEDPNTYIKYHTYGPHLFHTKNKVVWDYLSKFTEWTSYKHKVKALLEDGRYVTLPVNKETKEIVGEENIVDIFYRPYTRKMWNLDIDQLDPSVRNRVAIRDDMNEFYFPDDTYQALPKHGYNFLISNMLHHPNITIELNTEYQSRMAEFYDHIFTSQSIDTFFCSMYGELEYIGMHFEHQLVHLNSVLPATTVNFTHSLKHTRVTEWKNLPNHHRNCNHHTLLTYEIPLRYGHNLKYYPVKDPDGINKAKFDRYKLEAEKIKDRVTFIGRCGNYVYINMDQAVNMSLSVVRKYLNGNTT